MCAKEVWALPSATRNQWDICLVCGLQCNVLVLSFPLHVALILSEVCEAAVYFQSQKCLYHCGVKGGMHEINKISSLLLCLTLYCSSHPLVCVLFVLNHPIPSFYTVSSHLLTPSPAPPRGIYFFPPYPCFLHYLLFSLSLVD